MAVTITRTPWIDDDGTGTTGTVINNAVKTALYNDIDGGFAKLAQLAGANTFTGAQVITGSLTVSGIASLSSQLVMGNNLSTKISVSQAGGNIVALQNTDPGNSCNYMFFFNSASGLTGNIGQNGATGVIYNTTSDRRLKDDAGRATDLAALRAVVVHDFAWTADGRTDRGVFAQEAHAVFPRAVTPGTDETTATGALARPWMTDYSKFVPDLIVGWQQHDADLAELRALLVSTVL